MDASAAPARIVDFTALPLQRSRGQTHYSSVKSIPARTLASEEASYGQPAPRVPSATGEGCFNSPAFFMVANNTRRIQPMQVRLPGTGNAIAGTWAADGKFVPHTHTEGVAFFNFPGGLQSDGEGGPQTAASGIPV